MPKPYDADALRCLHNAMRAEARANDAKARMAQHQQAGHHDAAQQAEQAYNTNLLDVEHWLEAASDWERAHPLR